MAILANQKILTLDYWKRADELTEGDIVFDMEGNPAEVTLVQKYTPDQCYEVIFNDWLSVAGDDKLGFIAEDYFDRHKERQYKGRNKFNRPLRNISAQDLLDKPIYNPKFKFFIYSVRTTPPLQLPNQDLPVPPFIFGFWFINRKVNQQMIAPVNLGDTVHNAFKDAGYKLRFRDKKPKNRQMFETIPKIESQLAPNIPTRIPARYLMASAEQRIELLRGMLYAKRGSYNPAKDTFRITTQNYQLIKQIQWLVESLGHKTNLFSNELLKNHALTFKSKLPLIENQQSKPLKFVYGRRQIRQIIEIPRYPCVHIETDGKNGTFAVGEGFIACH